jgi:hypothetical protein
MNENRLSDYLDHMKRAGTQEAGPKCGWLSVDLDGLEALFQAFEAVAKVADL